MIIATHTNDRKALVKAIADELGTTSTYLRAPTYGATDDPREGGLLTVSRARTTNRLVFFCPGLTTLLYHKILIKTGNFQGLETLKKRNALTRC